MTWKLFEPHCLVCYIHCISLDPHSNSMLEWELDKYQHLLLCEILLCVVYHRITRPGQLHRVKSGTTKPQSVSASRLRHSSGCFRNTLTLLTDTPAPDGPSLKLLATYNDLFMVLWRLKRFSNFYRLRYGPSLPELNLGHTCLSYMAVPQVTHLYSFFSEVPWNEWMHFYSFLNVKCHIPGRKKNMQYFEVHAKNVWMIN